LHEGGAFIAERSPKAVVKRLGDQKRLGFRVALVDAVRR